MDTEITKEIKVMGIYNFSQEYKKLKPGIEVLLVNRRKKKMLLNLRVEPLPDDFTENYHYTK